MGVTLRGAGTDRKVQPVVLLPAHLSPPPPPTPLADPPGEPDGRVKMGLAEPRLSTTQQHTELEMRSVDILYLEPDSPDSTSLP